MNRYVVDLPPNITFYLGARFSSQKLNLQPWNHCIQVHESGPDSNQDSPSQLNNFDESSDSEVVHQLEDVEIHERSNDDTKRKIDLVKDRVRRTQSSPSTHDSGFINDSFGVSVGSIQPESLVDRRRYSIEASSHLSISKASHCSCSEVEIHEQPVKSIKRVSFRKQKDVATSTDSAHEYHQNSLTITTDIDANSLEDDFILSGKSIIRENEEFEVSFELHVIVEFMCSLIFSRYNTPF